MVEPAATELARPALVTLIETKVGVEFVVGEVIEFLLAPPHPATVRQAIKVKQTKALIRLILGNPLVMRSIAFLATILSVVGHSNLGKYNVGVHMPSW